MQGPALRGQVQVNPAPVLLVLLSLDEPVTRKTILARRVLAVRQPRHRPRGRRPGDPEPLQKLVHGVRLRCRSTHLQEDRGIEHRDFRIHGSENPHRVEQPVGM